MFHEQGVNLIGLMWGEYATLGGVFLYRLFGYLFSRQEKRNLQDKPTRIAAVAQVVFPIRPKCSVYS